MLAFKALFGAISQSLKQLFNRSTQQMVANVIYDVSGNGGRKITQLSNGWIVSAAYESASTKIYLYVSKDSGATWNQLCYSNSTSAAFAVVSYGTTVYLVRTNNTSSYTIVLWKFDATAQANVDISGTFITIDTQTAMGACSIAVDPSNGNLFATWSSKNAGLPNCFNVRSARSTDGGVTWKKNDNSAGVDQITSTNTSAYDGINPCIVVRNGNPHIFFQYNQSTNYWIYDYYWTGAAWSNSTVYNVATYTQSFPCATVSPDGAIHVIWTGTYVGWTNASNVLYSKSTDGGATWAAMANLSQENNAGGYAQGGTQGSSISCDASNNIYVFWGGNMFGVNTYAQIRKIVYSSGAWGAISNLTNVFGYYAYLPQLCANSLVADPPCIYRDDYSSMIKFMGNGLTESKIPPSVVGAAYDCSGNGGRKVTVLSNGWIVCAVVETTPKYVRWYVSKDNGLTWSQLTWYSHGIAINGLAICSYGTTVYTVLTQSGAWTNNYFIKFDAVSPPGTVTNQTMIDTGQTEFGSGCSIAVDSTGNLYATWCSKNATYANVFNLRHAKSVDGGTTWTKANGTAGVDQVTVQNTSGAVISNPSIVVVNGKPVIIHQYSYTSALQILCSYFDGSVWKGDDNSTTYPVFNGGAYAQTNPCAIVDSLGYIHVVWHGLDVTDTTANNIRYSKSTDGGATWSAPTKITTGNTYHQYAPSIAIDKNNNLYVAWYGYTVNSATYTNVRAIIFSGSWGNIQEITVGNVTGHRGYPSLCANYADFTDPLCIYYDNVNAAIRFRGIFTA